MQRAKRKKNILSERFFIISPLRGRDWTNGPVPTWLGREKGGEANPPKQVKNKQTSPQFGVFSSISGQQSSLVRAGRCYTQAGMRCEGCAGTGGSVRPRGSALRRGAAQLPARLPFPHTPHPEPRFARRSPGVVSQQPSIHGLRFRQCLR